MLTCLGRGDMLASQPSEHFEAAHKEEWTMMPVARLSPVPATVAVAAATWLTLLGTLPARAAATPAAPAGWFLAGSEPADYATHTDTEHAHGGKESAFLGASAASPRGFGTLMQDFVPKEFLGKRVRLSA